MSFKANYKEIDWSKKIDIPVKLYDNKRGPRADFPTPMIVGDYAPYECPVTGKTIEGRAEHNENLKRTGCRLLEPGEKEDNTKRGREYVEAKLDAAVDKAVDEVARDFLV